MKFGSLQVRTPDGAAREIPIELPSLVVGRADGNGIVIDDRITRDNWLPEARGDHR